MGNVLSHRSYAVSSPFPGSLSSSSPDHIIPEKAPCMGCPVEIDENSEDLKVPLSFSIAMYNSKSDSTHLFTLHSVGHTTRQVERHEGRERCLERGGGGKLTFLLVLCRVRLPAGGRRFQVQVEIWHEEDYVRQSRAQGPPWSVRPWRGECGTCDIKTRLATDIMWPRRGWFGLMHVCVCAGVCQLQLYSGFGTMETWEPPGPHRVWRRGTSHGEPHFLHNCQTDSILILHERVRVLTDACNMTVKSTSIMVLIILTCRGRSHKPAED